MRDSPLVTKLLCVGLVTLFAGAIGRSIFHYVTDSIGLIEFSAIEAVVSASLGFLFYAVISA